MVGHFSTPITPESGSFLHADSHSGGFLRPKRLCCKPDERVSEVIKQGNVFDSCFGADQGPVATPWCRLERTVRGRMRA